MKVKASEIDTLPPGAAVRLPDDPRVWVRMVDAPRMHFTGGLFCPTTGEWHGWQSLCWMDDEVELGTASSAELRRLHDENQRMRNALQTIANIALMDKGHWAKTIEAEALSAIRTEEQSK